MGDFKSSLSDSERIRLLELRRDIHRHPELGFEETRTAGVVADELRGLGLEPKTGLGKTGVSALIAGRGVENEGPTVLLRADMDALRVTEVEGRVYRSENEGLMHACGHDAHVATLLTACSVLKREADELPGCVQAIFQPAEEGMGGAKAMIADGVLDLHKPSAAFALHYWSGLPTGTVAVTPGCIMGAVDEFHLSIIGRGGHGAIPQNAVDAIVAASAVVTALQLLVSRLNDPLESVVCTVGQFNAGSGFNIIAGEADLTGTLRCMNTSIWEQLPGQFEEIVAGVCRAHACTYDLDYIRVDRPLINDTEMSAMVREVAGDLVGKDHVTDFRTLGGEDMGDFLNRLPGCFFFIGAGNLAKGIDAAHHHPAFDIDEDALPIGAEMLIRTARAYLKRQK